MPKKPIHDMKGELYQWLSSRSGEDLREAQARVRAYEAVREQPRPV